ncbi:MAG: hypothetical protein BGO11_03335 [Solirubrobacterales bacterium 70-9]|nr:MAG: hypothetical protein BGO11_03335 [Solirubrobacterales bacterium 70-9]
MNEETFWIDAPARPASAAPFGAATARAATGFAPVGAEALRDETIRHDVTVGRRLAGLAIVCAALFGLATLVGFAAEAYAAAPTATASAPTVTAAPPAPTHLVRTPGALVPIPASIPHEEGDMVDSRIVPDLRWIAARYPIFVTDGYSGPLANGEQIGCDECHASASDHLNGLAVDIVPATEDNPTCDLAWTPITALALWAEPVQEKPVAPFRWVGYEGDAGHGCGNHLHLSWNHAPAKPSELAEWVEVFPVAPGSARKARRKKATAKGPKGGIVQVTTGGVGTHSK